MLDFWVGNVGGGGGGVAISVAISKCIVELFLCGKVI